MADTGTPPVIPQELQQYNSYVEDPKWQIKFTIAWTSVLALFVVLTLPSIVRNCPKWISQTFGISENWRGRYARLSNQEPETGSFNQLGKNSCRKTRSKSELQTTNKRSMDRTLRARLTSVIRGAFYWTPPGIGLNAGQFILVAAYAATVLTCICTSAPLLSNSNRAGFLAIAQLPVVFLLASKNSILSLLLPPFYSYIHLNALHRWAGRTLFLSAVLHGSMWIANHIEWGLPIIGEQKETSGVAALGVLSIIVLTSLRPVRLWAWGIFYWVHFLAVPAFFITICYHTIYAPPWIFAPIAFYAFDLLMRAGRFRLKDAHLIRIDNQMTIIHIPDCDTGFRAGQHLRMRVLFAGLTFEAHPLSIMCAPSSTQGTANQATCVRTRDVMAYHDDTDTTLTSGTTPGILLGARVVGDWTRAINHYAQKREKEALDDDIAEADPGDVAKQSGSPSTASSILAPPIPRKVVPIPVQVVFDGPYGGCSLDLPDYERVLLVAGGSGATFTVGLLDELVAGSILPSDACQKLRTRTRMVHFVWCTRSFSSIKWFAPLLRSIARTASSPSSVISLRMTIYVTCMCAPEDMNIPGLEIRVGGRPKMSQLVGALGGLSVDDIPGNRSPKDIQEDLCDCGCLDEALGSGEDRTEPQEAEGEGKSKADDDVEKQTRANAFASENFHGGLAVCASGPEGLTREAANTVARYASKGREVGLHTEVFAM